MLFSVATAERIEWSGEHPTLLWSLHPCVSIDDRVEPDNDNARRMTLVERHNVPRMDMFSSHARAGVLVPIGLQSANDGTPSTRKGGVSLPQRSEDRRRGGLPLEDVEVGLQYFGKRFLNPLLGRWVSADPLAIHAPGEADLNVYAYVSGAVLKNVDPLGLEEDAANGVSFDANQSTSEGGVSDGTNVENQSSAPDPRMVSGSSAPSCWASGCNPVTGDDQPTTHEQFRISDEAGRGIVEFAGGMTPVVSEGMDVRTLLAPESTTTERVLAAVGIVLPGVSGGMLKAAGEAAELIAKSGDDLISSAGKASAEATDVAQKAGDAVKDPGSYVNLASPERTQHILHGDKSGGGHLYPGNPGKSSFPESWSAEKVMHEISDVATDPASQVGSARGARSIVQGTRDGIDIAVILDSPKKGGGIVTGFPTNVPRNP